MVDLSRFMNMPRAPDDRIEDRTNLSPLDRLLTDLNTARLRTGNGAREMINGLFGREENSLPINRSPADFFSDDQLLKWFRANAEANGLKGKEAEQYVRERLKFSRGTSQYSDWYD